MLCFLSVTTVLCYPYKTRRQWCLLYLFLNPHCWFDKNGFMEFDVWQKRNTCQSVVFLHVALFNRSYQKNIFDKRCVIKHLLKYFTYIKFVKVSCLFTIVFRTISLYLFARRLHIFYSKMSKILEKVFAKGIRILSIFINFDK